MFQPPLSPECLVAQVIKYKLSHQHEQTYSCYFSWLGVCSSSLCLRGIPPASHSHALYGHHPPGSWLLAKKMSEHQPMTSCLQDDSYQLKNDIGVNPTFWTEEMCHYAESPFRWSLQWYCSNIYSEFLILNSLHSDKISKIWNGCHSGGRLGSWSCRLWGGVLHARTLDKSRLANTWGCFKARALDQQTRTEDDSHLF